MGSHRVQRVENELRQIISSYLAMRTHGEFEHIVSVTRVQVTKDLRQARVLVSFLPEGGDIKSDLQRLDDFAPEIQHQISKQVRMKYLPKIRFVEDKGIQNFLKVEQKLREIGLSEARSS